MSGLTKRLGALEGAAGLSGYWRHEDWMDYFARKSRGEAMDHVIPRPSPGLLALLRQVEADDATGQ